MPLLRRVAPIQQGLFPVEEVLSVEAPQCDPLQAPGAPADAAPTGLRMAGINRGSNLDKSLVGLKGAGFSEGESLACEDGTKIVADGGYIDIRHANLRFSPRAQSVIGFFVDEAHRGQGIGTNLLLEALKRYQDLGGQVSSIASLKVFYGCGFRNPENPHASFQETLNAFYESGGSLFMAINDDQGRPYSKLEQPPGLKIDPLLRMTRIPAEQPLVSFTKVALPNGWLSNMSPHPVTHEGLEFRTTEALFHALRWKDHPAVVEEIRAQKSPMAAKMVTKKHMHLLGAEAFAQDMDNMRVCLRLKVEQHPDLKDALLSTGELPIVEDVTSRKRGARWGMARVGGWWEGENLLGQLWMDLRAQLRAECGLVVGTENVAEMSPKSMNAARVSLMPLEFREFSASGYAGRTRENARADITIAIAANFATAGEKLTRRVVQENGKAYLGLPYAEVRKGDLEPILQAVKALNQLGERLGRREISLNIAGNGLYTLRGGSQDLVDEGIYAFFKAVVEHPGLRVRIASARSGGQTGVDEAGVKATRRLGIPSLVVAPKGWVFRGADGVDVADEARFKARFGS